MRQDDCRLHFFEFRDLTVVSGIATGGSGLKARAPEPFPLYRASPLPLSLSRPLGVPAFLGCLPRVEAAALRRLSLRSCRGRVRVVRCEEETFLPTRRPQRVSLLSSGRARVGRRRRGGSRDACYSPSGFPGSVGGDRENRILGVGRGSGSRVVTPEGRDRRPGHDVVAPERPAVIGSGRDKPGRRLLVATGVAVTSLSRLLTAFDRLFGVALGAAIATRAVFVLRGARRRWSFLREGPNGSALHVEPCGGHDEQSYGVSDRVVFPYRASCSFTSAIPFVGETSQQRQGGGDGAVGEDPVARQVRELVEHQDESDMPVQGQVQEEVSVEESMAHPQPGQAAVGGQPPVPPPAVPRQQADLEEEQPAVLRPSGTGSTWVGQQRMTVTEDKTALLERFLHLQPPMFSGEYDPDKAESWTHELECTFETMECLEEDQVRLVVYQLKGTAHEWWRVQRRTHFQRQRLDQITWQQFLEIFHGEYFPDYARRERRDMFHELVQDDLTISQYHQRFVWLLRHVPHVAGSEQACAERFIAGLRPDLRWVVTAHMCTTLGEAVAKATALERETWQQ
ncbi:hypothetical protein Taro_010263 [Colocasia esculenta]|uniref:Retrotransposon gag domain-containing protein n=1 Tax=Colocasia esculenta TaxID=4460 RepID=A0A843U344_COLES|nr:hypothetical protein [Colocasia esculenta]